jgi:periplasmic copper chaperone A
MHRKSEHLRAKNTFILATLWLGWLAAPAAASEHPANLDGLAVEHAEIVLSPPGGPAAAGYLTVWNGTRELKGLTAVESADFGSISIHRMEIDSGISRMRRVDRLTIPGHAELLMRPGGVHLMLSDPKRELSLDSGVDLVLVFDDGQRLGAKATLLPTGAGIVDHRHGTGDASTAK